VQPPIAADDRPTHPSRHDRAGATHWYRVIHGDNTIDRLTITDVEHLLHRAGVDMSELHDVDPAA